MTQTGDDFKELVRSRTDIVALIGESVTLHPVRGGREHKGLCPFHDDHNPSFCVYPDRQSFRCWSGTCNKGGDCYSFVMERDKIGFREALILLANRINLPIPQTYQPRDAAAGDKSTLFDVVAWAEQQFHECLLRDPAAETARDYLFQKRRLSRATVEQFRLGYHPNNWQWLLNKAGRKYSPQQLESVWLAMSKPTDPGRYFDMFVDRIMFPIRDAQNRAVAFGGRVLPGAPNEGSKYINSADTPLFHKSHLVYGLDQARSAIQKEKYAVVMEGYMDCIAAHQAGIRNAVATLGTALVDTHVALLKRFTERVVLNFDGDEAGVRATDRSLAQFLSQGIDLRVLTIPESLDPDEYIDRYGADRFRTLLETATDAWDHRFRSGVAKHGLDTVIGRQKVLEEMLEILSHVPRETPRGLAASWELRESIMVTRLIQQLGVPEKELRRQLAALRARASEQNPNYPPPQKSASANSSSSAELFPARPTAGDRAERDLLGIILAAPEFISQIRAEVRLDDLRIPQLFRLLELCFALADDGTPPGYDQVTLATEDLYLKRVAAFLAEHAAAVKVTPELVTQTLGYFRRRRELEEVGHKPHLHLARVEETTSAPSGEEDDRRFPKGRADPHRETPSPAGRSDHAGETGTPYVRVEQAGEASSEIQGQDDAKERLRRATLLHQKRSAKPT